MSRPIIYDVTPLARRSVAEVGGIDRVAFAYGRHFAATSRPAVWGAYYGPLAPHPITAGQLGAILRNTEQAWRDDIPAATDSALAAIWTWLETSRAIPLPASRFTQLSPFDRARRGAFHARHWLRGAIRPLPQDAVYLNVFNAGREHHFLFDWLKRRSDVKAVFFVHDLLPIDYPDFFPAHYVTLTERRLATVANHGAAFITGTEVVRDRLAVALRQRGRLAPRIHVSPLPSPLAAAEPPTFANAALTPYFAMIGTIEPRKNHLLLLNLWREFASRSEKIPKLVVLGGLGWNTQQTLDAFERCSAIRPHVLKAPKVSSSALAQLVLNAQALLMPSFAEGYGLPIVEALTLGTPVIASDIPVFREITQDCAALLPPLHGSGWRDAILAYSDRQSSAYKAAKVKAGQFRAPNWLDYFKSLEAFLDSL